MSCGMGRVTIRFLRRCGSPFLKSSLLRFAAASRIVQENSDAFGLTNLFRNCGGSFGISLITTGSGRRGSLQQSVLVQLVIPLPRHFSKGLILLSLSYRIRPLPALMPGWLRWHCLCAIDAKVCSCRSRLLRALKEQAPVVVLP